MAGQPSLWFQADYGIFYAGRFSEDTQPGRTLITGTVGRLQNSSHEAALREKSARSFFSVQPLCLCG